MARALDPLRSWGQLRDEFDRLFTDVMGTTPRAAISPLFGNRAFPALNVWETDQAFLAEAELPGLKHDDLDIAVQGNEVTIQGKRGDGEDKGATYHRRERGVGSFSRVLRLPAEVDAERVTAELEDGVLLLTLPKTEQAKPRKITVKARG